MDKLSALFELKDQARILALQAELRDLAEDFLSAALTSPIGLPTGPASKTLDQRKRWLESQVINPTATLLSAMDDANAPMFADWPEALTAPVPDRSVLAGELAKLHKVARELKWALDDRLADRKFSTSTSAFMLEFAVALVGIYRRFSPRPNQNRTEHDRINQPSSLYVTFLDLSTKEIFQEEFAISRDVADEATSM